MLKNDKPNNYIEYLFLIEKLKNELDDEENNEKIKELEKEFNPKNYEEAVLIKEELLIEINKYNEAVFNEEELPYSDEEIDILMAEYQTFNDQLKLTKKEKIDKLDEEDKVTLESGEVVEVESVFDKIHFSFYLYILFSIVLILFSSVFSYQIGNNLMTNYLNKFYEEIYARTSDQMAMITDPTLVMGEGRYWFHTVFFFCLIPVILLIISTVIFILSRRLNKLNKKLFLIVYLLHILIVVSSILIIFFSKIYNEAQDYYNNMSIYYFYYIYSQNA